MNDKTITSNISEKLLFILAILFQKVKGKRRERIG